LRELVLKPFKAKCQSDRAYTASLPFQIKLKPLELSYGLARVFDTMNGGLDHKSDGVIFTSSIAPYTHGTCDKMLKWKPSDENSVDFKILDVESAGNGKPEITIGIWQGGRVHSDFGRLTLSDADVSEFRTERDNLKGIIVECRQVLRNC
jgi:mRNA guanylyltransferase